MSTLRLVAIAVSLLITVAGCGKADDRDQQPAEAPSGGGSNPSAPGLSPLAGLFTKGLEQPGPYEAPRQSADYADGVDHVAVLELSAPVGELPSFSLTGGEALTPLRELTGHIAAAAADPHVKAMILRTSDLQIDLVHARELHAALRAFTGNGERELACHTERIAEAGYLVLTACDRIGLAPLGEVVIAGPSLTPIHLKGLLDTLGVRADFLHVGAFKGAAEPLTREQPSPEMLATLSAIVARMHASYVELIASGRGIENTAAQELVDKALFMADDAVAADLVDEVATWEAFLEARRAGRAWKQLRVSHQMMGKIGDFAALQRFLGLLPPERPSDPHVAVMYAVGNVVDGAGAGVVGAREEIASRTVVATLRALAADDAVLGVVLRVDSGGGSALASEQIWQAVRELAARKPTVASMGSVAASGGYYISVGTRRIFAEPETLTGSIGVVGGKIVVGSALERVGVKTYDVHRGARARMFSPVAAFSEAERATVRAAMERTYATFVERVAAGRKLDPAAVLAVAEGRVWTGADAKANGLVDEIGGLDDAIAHVRREAGSSADVALEVYPPEPTLRDILAGLGGVQTGPLAALAQAAIGLSPGGRPPLVDRGTSGSTSLRQLARMIATLDSLLVHGRAPVLALSNVWAGTLMR